MVTIDKTILVCRIRAKLGGEGMGVLYNTEDTNLHRFIAHKFLSGQVPGTRACMSPEEDTCESSCGKRGVK